ncbi:hypothetical protein [Jiangella alkaliphila]|uniref:Uncharacterized protein n=1 Tax=Jiangella alkaliphila TaxID=419479 RepID=A0A1H2L2N8_9ACTN|nr:hypothetical protein [Jiangella alkaliphila]SDU74776.1 hypothetical protein SAMN04488563_4813 [Jiangella alkaliphila]
MNEQSKRKAQAPEADQVRGEGHGLRDLLGFDGGLQADPVLTQRITNLEIALHGTTVSGRRRRLNWSGINETGVVFTSIEDALTKSAPPDRPDTDLPDGHDPSYSGG